MTEERFAIAAGGLGFVQEFVNTRCLVAPHGTDPLLDLTDAQAWLDQALARYRPVAAGPVALEATDLGRLRRARSAIAGLIDGDGDTSGVDATIGMHVGAGGEAVVEHRGSGTARVLGIVLTELFVAQQAGTWPRLKICRNDRCAVAFYDRSPNASAVWHSAKRCGNAPNLRASRARRRADPAETVSQ